MSIWIFIWILVSAALIYFAVWTAWILLKQKRAWKSFADKHKMRYTSPALFNSPNLSGIYKGYSVSMFPCQHQTPDARNLRKLTGVEIELKSKMPLGGAVGTGGMVTVIEELDFRAEIRPRYKWWDQSYIIRAEDEDVMEAYLSEERLRALVSLARVQNAWMIFIFKDNQTILRVDTPDPMESEKKIARILHKMIEVAKVLELNPNEGKRLMAPKVKQGQNKVLPVKDKDLGPVGLELEDEDVAASGDSGASVEEGDVVDNKKEP